MSRTAIRRSSAWRRLPWPMHEIRRLGDWGHASNHLGRAWERFAGERLLDDPCPWFSAEGSFRPSALVPFGQDEGLLARFSAAGLRAPDGLVAGCRRGRPVIQPVDFKFSLDHAEDGQIQPEVALLAGTFLEPHTSEAIGAAYGIGSFPDWPEYVVPGVLVAPPSVSNEHARVPRSPLIRWLGADPTFFDGLTASDLAHWLRDRDGVGLIDDDFDLAEAYYRLAAGIGGAVTRLDRPIFAIVEPGETPLASIDRVHAVAERLGAPSAAQLVECLRPLMAERRERQQRLSNVLRRPIDRAALARAVGQPAESAPEVWPAGARRALAEALAADRVETLARGNRLIADGATEDEALAALGRDHRARSRRFVENLHTLVSRYTE